MSSKSQAELPRKKVLHPLGATVGQDAGAWCEKEMTVSCPPDVSLLTREGGLGAGQEGIWGFPGTGLGFLP